MSFSAEALECAQQILAVLNTYDVFGAERNLGDAWEILQARLVCTR